MLMGASVSCGLIARAESEDQGRADGGLGSGAKAVAGGAKAEAPRVGRGLLVSTVHAGTAGAVRPSPVRGAKAGGLYPGLRRRSFRPRTIGSRRTESIRAPGAAHCGHEFDNLHRRIAARLGVHRAASRRPARCASRGRWGAPSAPSKVVRRGVRRLGRPVAPSAEPLRLSPDHLV